MDINRIEWLFERYFDKTCTEGERQEFLQLIASGEQDEALKALLDSKLQHYAPDRKIDNKEADALFSAVLKKAESPEPATVLSLKPKPSWKKWMVAAAVVLVAGLGGIYLMNSNNRKEEKKTAMQDQAPAATNPVHTGKPSPILRLADGREISLDTAADGTLASQGGATISKNKDGELSYHHHTGANNGQVQYNTLLTPKGSQYKITLPDGSKVWLNAASGISYPTAFTGNMRKVTVQGEAYFEIVKDPQKPFIVNTEKMDVEVMGTSFNLNSYLDEPILRTSLVEGSVRVSRPAGGVDPQILKPGQQAMVDVQPGTPIKVQTADIDAATAWKNGFFHFDGTPAREVMRQISRWYDVDIIANGRLTKHFRGMLPRNASLDEAIHMLSLTGEFKYKIEGRTVTILP
ncbi:MAG: FecR domain-containing protein [Chitinophagaceae bacterium]|nr:FecR domain-containing protein [Chitinophagaceae bacterium]